MLSCDASRLFGLDIKGRDCGDEAAQWFTDFLKSEAFRVVQFEKDMKGRPSREILPPFVQNYQVSYRGALHFHLSPSRLAPSGPQGASLRALVAKCSNTPGEWSWAGIGDEREVDREPGIGYRRCCEGRIRETPREVGIQEKTSWGGEK